MEKILNGQAIVGVACDRQPFEGYVGVRMNESNEREQIAINSRGEWLPLNDLFDVRCTGRKLREDLSNTIDSFVQKLDPEKTKDMPESDKNTLYSAALQAAGPDAKDNEEEVKGMVDSALMASQISSGTDSNKGVVEKYMKEDSPMEGARMTSTYFPTATQVGEEHSTILDEIVGLLDYTYDEDDLLDTIVEETGFGADEARAILEQAKSIKAGDSVNAADPSSEASESDFVESEFSSVIDAYEEANGNNNIEGMYEALCSHFAVSDGKEILREAGNHYDAVTKLVEKVSHMREAAITPTLAAKQLLSNGQAPLSQLFAAGGQVAMTGKITPGKDTEAVDKAIAYLKSVASPNMVLLDDAKKPVRAGVWVDAVYAAIRKMVAPTITAANKQVAENRLSMVHDRLSQAFAA